ncbi:hypothetical protein GH733_004126 [Mirounga leonina]|nr:hypothetical protein GH733_004126 [Mirounga leonina]
MEIPLRASLMLLCVQLNWSNGQPPMEQGPPDLKVQERKSFTVNCSYRENILGFFQRFLCAASSSVLLTRLYPAPKLCSARHPLLQGLQGTDFNFEQRETRGAFYNLMSNTSFEDRGQRDDVFKYHLMYFVSQCEVFTLLKLVQNPEAQYQKGERTKEQRDNRIKFLPLSSFIISGSEAEVPRGTRENPDQSARLFFTPQGRAVSMPLVSLLWAVVVSTCLGSSTAQTVTQTQPDMRVRETETVTLHCTYDTSDSNYYLFWYKQPPSGEMILIIRQEAYKQENATKDRFSVNFQKPKKSFSLRISDSQLEDAAIKRLTALINFEPDITNSTPDIPFPVVEQ